MPRKKRRCLARLRGIKIALANRKFQYLENLEDDLISEYKDIFRFEKTYWLQRSRE